ARRASTTTLRERVIEALLAHLDALPALRLPGGFLRRLHARLHLRLLLLELGELGSGRGAIGVVLRRHQLVDRLVDLLAQLVEIDRDLVELVLGLFRVLARLVGLLLRLLELELLLALRSGRRWRRLLLRSRLATAARHDECEQRCALHARATAPAWVLPCAV